MWRWAFCTAAPEGCRSKRSRRELSSAYGHVRFNDSALGAAAQEKGSPSGRHKRVQAKRLSAQRRMVSHGLATTGFQADGIVYSSEARMVLRSSMT